MRFTTVSATDGYEARTAQAKSFDDVIPRQRFAGDAGDPSLSPATPSGRFSLPTGKYSHGRKSFREDFP